MGYAETEPTAPLTGDCYLVKDDATIWGTVCLKNEILCYAGNPEGSGSGSGSGSGEGDGWIVLPFKITEINDALQFLYFEAANIALAPVDGLAAASVQSAIEEITAALVAEGIITV
jgi:hypothetical protein